MWDLQSLVRSPFFIYPSLSSLSRSGFTYGKLISCVDVLLQCAWIIGFLFILLFFIIFNMNRYTYKQLIPLYFSVMIFYKPTIHVDIDLCTFLSWFIQRVVLLSNKYDRSNTDKIIKKKSYSNVKTLTTQKVYLTFICLLYHVFRQLLFNKDTMLFHKKI